MRHVVSVWRCSRRSLFSPQAKPEAPVHLTPGAPPASPEVIAALAEKDRQLFDAAFNCKIDLLKTLVADDFEFFHDKGGLTATSGKQFIDNVADGCKREEAGTNFHARRELVEGTMTVHLIGDYGAMQMGTHRFFALRKGRAGSVDRNRQVHRSVEEGRRHLEARARDQLRPRAGAAAE